MSQSAGPLAARIGESTGYYSFGIIFLAVGFLFSLGTLAMAGVAQFFSSLGAVLLAAGILVSLFGKIEKRLIEVEQAIMSFRGPPAP